MGLESPLFPSGLQVALRDVLVQCQMADLCPGLPGTVECTGLLMSSSWIMKRFCLNL